MTRKRRKYTRPPVIAERRSCPLCTPETTRAEHISHRVCLACGKPLPPTMRLDTLFCNGKCRHDDFIFRNGIKGHN